MRRPTADTTPLAELPEDEALVAELFPGTRLRGPLRWLVVAAHPGDECMGATWLMPRVRSLHVVHVTDGAPRERSLWPAHAPATREAYAQLRRAEARAALTLAGVDVGHLRCLGVVDQSAAHGLVPLVRKLQAVLTQLQPQVVLVPSYEGGHPDKDATAFAMHVALALLKQGGLPVPLLVEMVAYHRWEGALRCGAFLPQPGAGEAVVRALGARGSLLKRRMFGCIASQAQLLASFPLEEERFRAAPSPDFTQPPHAGVLHYESLGWPLDGTRWRALTGEALAGLGLGGGACP